MNVHAVIGDGGVGKSTLIRHLSGKARVGVVPIRLSDGTDVRVLVYPSSPQEQNSRRTPRQLVAYLRRYPADILLIALREYPLNSRPGGAGYLEVFEAVGWPVTKLESLWLDPDITGVLRVPMGCEEWDGRAEVHTAHSEVRNAPSNILARAVRRNWGWM